jgi:hypothetical protein
MADFNTWSRENLEQFAQEAQLKILQQEQEIGHLKQDLKDALEACRTLMRKDASPGGQ